MTKSKIVNTYEELIKLMENLERYKFRWSSGCLPTDCKNFIKEEDLPIKIYIGYGCCSPKELCYKRIH